MTPTLQLRVQKRSSFNSEGTHWNYVLQQYFSDDKGGGEWRDVPLVDEECKEGKYE